MNRRDFALSDWMFEIEETSGTRLANALAAVHAGTEAPRTKVRAAMQLVEQRQRRMVDALRETLRATKL